MRTFRDFLKEEFRKNKKFEKDFYKEVEKTRISLEIVYQREKAGLTQAELAKKINTSQSAIARLENSNYHNYSITVLRRVAEALDLELVVSFRGKDEKEKEMEEETCQIVPDNKRESEFRLLEKRFQNQEELIKELVDKVGNLANERDIYQYSQTLGHSETKGIRSSYNTLAKA